jgi:hypothetical protein
MERAEPRSICTAASTSFAFRSFIFASAISRSWVTVTWPARSVLGFLAPAVMPAAFCHEGKAAIRIDRDHGRDRHANIHLLRRRIKRLAELHNVDAALTQRRTNWRRRVGLAGRNLQFDVSGYLFRHTVCSSSGRTAPLGCRCAVRAETSPPARMVWYQVVFSTCEYSRSTGVARPKIETDTFKRERSASTSSTMPLNEANGPSQTRTCSPIS